MFVSYFFLLKINFIIIINFNFNLKDFIFKFFPIIHYSIKFFNYLIIMICYNDFKYNFIIFI